MNNIKVEQFYAINQFRIYGDDVNILQSYLSMYCFRQRLGLFNNNK